MSQSTIIGVEHFEQLYRAKCPCRTMLVCDKSFNCLPETVKEVYFSHKSTFIMFDDFTPNPLYEQVCNGVELFNKNHCDAIVAIGGGSTIDVAKCIKLFCKMNPSINYLQQEYTNSGITLIAVPTTAGTGSESTRYAVIYFDGKKQSITHDSIVPNYAVLEPSVLKSLPLGQKKSTMLDALCQGIESWWSVNSTSESKKYSENAVRAIVANYKAYIYDNDPEAATQIMIAANNAGKAINITQTTAAHAMSYKITSMYQYPHGMAVAVCLPVVWEYMINNTSKCIDNRGADYLQSVFDEIPIDVKWFNALLAELQIKKPISMCYDTDIRVLTDSVNPIRLKNNPVMLESPVLKSMYERIVKKV